MGLGGVISNLLSLGEKLLAVVDDHAQASSSSWPPPVQSQQIEAELKKLIRMLWRIKAVLYNVERREIIDIAFKLCLQELRIVAYDAEDVLEEYHYEVLRTQVEATDASQTDSRKGKQITFPDDVYNQIKQINDRFYEIAEDRFAVQLLDEDGLKHNSGMKIAPTSHMVNMSTIFGRENEKEKLVGILGSDECHDGDVIKVVAIVGVGGIGKTTLAQLAYNNQSIKQRFDQFGWICVSEDFNVELLMKAVIESITGISCRLENLSALQNVISSEIRGKRVLLVLDDVRNENRSLWELFRGSFISAKQVVILVTTRSQCVAKIMQTMPTFNLGYMSEEHCWLLFQHYAFGVLNPKDQNFVKIGKQICDKCEKLPLAIKVMARFLRHETQEECWKEILESELWESDASNEISPASRKSYAHRPTIFPPLQITYAHLPTHLKPCFLYCSMFPKDYVFTVRRLVQLWIAQGYIESNKKKNKEDIGWEYAKQLMERSLFDGQYGGKEFSLAEFKLHDMVHDLARFNSGNRCYSIEAGKVPDIPNGLYHLFIGNFVRLPEPLPSDKFTSLRTLIIGGLVGNCFGIINFSKVQKLRALELGSKICELESLFSVVNLKHLRYLSISNWQFERLPERLCSLYSLQSLILSDYVQLKELPKSMENLINLEELVIDGCSHLEILPISLCKLKTLRKLFIARCPYLGELPTDVGCLTRLQVLEISHTKIVSLPPSLSKFVGMHVNLSCQTIGWLKDFVDLNGTLSLVGLNRMSGLADAQCADLVAMHNLQCLELCWSEPEHSNLHPYFDSSNGAHGNVLRLGVKMSFHQNTFLDDQNDFALLEVLQPHPNLRELHIIDYSGIELPSWIGNPTSCSSLERIVLVRCKNLTSLPFGNLSKIKHLEIYQCSSLKFLHGESLPLELQQLEIYGCGELISIPGIQNLKSLVKFNIHGCRNLESLMDGESSYQNSLSGLSAFNSLRSFQIELCPKLHLFADELPPVESCKIEMIGCPDVKERGTQHSITYKDIEANDETQIVVHCTKKKRFAQDCLQSTAKERKKRAGTYSHSSKLKIGEFVFLRILPVQGKCSFSNTKKLSPRYIGPFEILQSVEEVEYELALPPPLDRTPPLFPVSRLEQDILILSHIVDYCELYLEDDLTYKEKPLRILKRKELKLRSKIVQQVLVQWELHSENEATWELESKIYGKYPELFRNSDPAASIATSPAINSFRNRALQLETESKHSSAERKLNTGPSTHRPGKEPMEHPGKEKSKQPTQPKFMASAIRAARPKNPVEPNITRRRREMN